MDILLTVIIILLGIYTVISIIGAVLQLKQRHQLPERMRVLESACLMTSKSEAMTRHRLERLEEAHARTREAVDNILWETMEEREEFEPMKEGETCGSISLDELPD